MGEVYCAQDSRLGRDVALKVLPSELAADLERVARFEREARTLAALNHPNIAQIYGVEEGLAESAPHAEGTRLTALVMELVDGADLASGSRQGRWLSTRRSCSPAR